MTMHFDHTETSTTSPVELTSTTILKLSLNDWIKLVVGAFVLILSICAPIYSYVKSVEKDQSLLEKRVQMLEDERNVRDLQNKHILDTIDRMERGVSSLETKVSTLLMNQEILKSQQYGSK